MDEGEYRDILLNFRYGEQVVLSLPLDSWVQSILWLEASPECVMGRVCRVAGEGRIAAISVNVIRSFPNRTVYDCRTD